MNDVRNVMKKISVFMEQLEAEAWEKAKKHIANLIQNEGQLDKIEQLKHTYSRKKYSTEAKMKSAMQTQLDGVRDGLTKLSSSLTEMVEVEHQMKSMNKILKSLPDFNEKLTDIRDEGMRHSQYVVAKESLKYIFNVPENVEKTRALINEGNLLFAHKCLSDLEHSRDELLLELHRLPNQSKLDTAMLKAYFADVEELSKMLETQIKLILSRALNTVRKEPTVIVSALRIIEREEHADRSDVYFKGDFKPPGRPKRWKAMAYDVLQKGVESRIQGTQIEERNDDKLWLVRYLELIRKLFLEDLRVVKSLCVPCFPVKYDIFQQYIVWYHEALSTHLTDIIENGIEGNEYFTILSWVLHTYNSDEMMGHPALKEYTQFLGPLLPTSLIDSLKEEYLNMMENNYKQWLQNTINKEKEEWYSNNPPHIDTATPVIIFKMINDNLEVAKTISQDLAYKALILSLDQVIKYSYRYQEAIIELKNKHFEDRNSIMYFTSYMIMVLNNCHQLTELGGQLLLLYCTNNAHEALNVSFKIFSETFIELRNEATQYLLGEVFMDVDKHFNELFTNKWLPGNTIQIDTICVTLDDYFQDYKSLVESNYKHVITEVRFIIAKKYLTNMLQRKVCFKTLEEAKTMSDKIVKEVRLIQRVFESSTFSVAEEDDCLEVIITLADLLRCEDEMIELDLHRIIEKCPDISEEHLLRLMYLRGDLTKTNIREKIKFTLMNKDPKAISKHNLFKQLVFPKTVTLFT